MPTGVYPRKVKDLTGRIFGRLEALRCVGRTKNGNAIWLCMCSCDGKEIEVASGNLRLGHTNSCGCLRRATHVRDLTGMVKGRLTALQDTGRQAKNGKHIWLFRCSCDGREVEIPNSNFTSGNTSSCGCLQREQQAAIKAGRAFGARFKDLTNQVFSRITVIRCIGRNNRGQAVWLCRCTCGSETEVASGNLASGNTSSCGCIQREKRASGNVKHGHSGDPTHQSWMAAITRTTNPKIKDWSHYGGANPPVTICDRWRNSFAAFLEDMGERSQGTTLGRFADLGNYSCGQCEQCNANGWKLNCAWQTYKEQWVERRIKKQSQLVAA